jgi:hypothetical protein
MIGICSKELVRIFLLIGKLSKEKVRIFFTHWKKVEKRGSHWKKL